MSLIVINASLTQKLLPMATCIEVLKPAMIAVSSGSADSPPRLLSALPDDRGWFALMPGSAADLNSYGAKIVGLHPNNPSQGRPAVQGFICLFDLATGDPIGLVDGASITTTRTAAASALATHYLAREDALSCGILGTGTQALSHVEAMLAVRKLKQFVVWGRNVHRARNLAAQITARFDCDCRVSSEPAAAASCDIICTVTGSPMPILHGEWVRPGTHINLVGAHSLQTREADTALIEKSSIYVDSLTSTLNEGGDIMIPIQEGAIDQSRILGELGSLVAGELAGRKGDEEITLYNALGITTQDLYAAHYVLNIAKQTNVGVTIN